ncbi:T9SS type A sorting domain-containing protein [Polaribacter haliotis]|uniref:T9SS type A sorting domain-containing protein n=1 Tax=Polaribacter haliotis TaxID=1888915 RepID=A0A7L8AHY8_9FLAO|nr:T9SS type A sorting domain-containing protein [Polaribacter haliotis]QOD61544.1 T9SS type A sorting domain-containing protein [Polaribacter haliotis]
MKTKLLLLGILFISIHFSAQKLPAGSVDNSFTTFGTGFNASVTAIVTQSDGKILIGGHFTTYDGIPRYKIARLNSDGSLDTTFQYTTEVTGDDFSSVSIEAIKIQSDGKILIGFSVLTNSLKAYSYVYRLNTNGTLDSSFNKVTFTGLNNSNSCSVRSIGILPNSNIIFGGDFVKVNDQNRTNVASINSSGSLLSSFNFYPFSLSGIYFSSVNKVKIQSDGKVLVGGRATINTNSDTRGLIRLNSNGSLDNAFNLNTPDTFVTSIAIEAGGKILIGDISKVYRINTDGTVDTNLTSINDRIESIGIDSNDKILIGGRFTKVGGITRNKIARLNSDGSLDFSFNPGTAASEQYRYIYDISIQSDNKILIGGNFTNFNGESKRYIAKLFSKETETVVNIPDTNFEQALIDLGYDTNGLNGNILQKEAEEIKVLVMPAKNISNLSGIDKMPNLESLSVSFNNITEVDLSNNLKINVLRIDNNPLSSLNVSMLPNLLQLSIGGTSTDIVPITSLNIKNNPLLVSLEIEYTAISSIDFTNNLNLKTLKIQHQNLTEIDLLNHNQLRDLYLASNNLKSINLSNNLDLQTIVLDNNDLTEIDINNNLKLEYLAISNNSISTLKTDNNIKIISITADRNILEDIDLSNNINLTNLNLSYNNLTQVNLKNGANTLAKFFQLNANTNLSCVQVDDVAYSNTNWRNINDSSVYSTDCYSKAVVVIPDTNFEQALIDLGFDTNGLNGNILTSEAKVIDTLKISTPINNILLPNVNTKIKDLTGIEKMPNLVYLDAAENELTTIDVSKNTLLEIISIDRNQIATLDVSKNENLKQLYAYNNVLTEVTFGNNTVLERLYIGNNQLVSLDLSSMTNLKRALAENNKLTSMDVSNSPNLEWYTIFGNQVTSVDFSNNSKLTSVWAWDNQITSLVISNLTALESLRISNNKISTIDATANVNLKSFEMDGNGLTNLDLSKNTLLEFIFIGNNPNIGDFDSSIYPNLKKIGIDNIGTSIANFTNAPNLEEIYATNNNIGSINLSNNAKLTRLWLNDNPNLTGLSVANLLVLEEFAANNTKTATMDVTANVDLKILELGNTGLSTIDVTKNTKLERLSLYDNNMTDIDLSQNVLLKKLDINQIKKTGYLDLSQHTLLEDVVVNNTLLASLNLNNGNNVAITRIEIKHNSNLTCVQVDDVTNATNNWTFVDENINFSKDCGGPVVYIPDAKMKAALLADTVINSNGDAEIQVSEAEAITQPLDGVGLGILDLTGVEAFVNITGLNISNNNLTNLNLSKNTKLVSLNVANNQLTNLDISLLTQLENLVASENQLSTIDFSNNLEIASVNIGKNPFTNIDFSVNTKLSYLFINECGLNTLDVTNNTLLTFLGAYNNNLASIDVSKNNLLTYLGVFENKLTSIDVSKNTELITFSIRDNQLTSLDVSKNTKLKQLFFLNNKVASIDVSNNLLIEKIGFENNLIEELDLSKQTNLKDVYASNNKLLKVNLKNGNNININDLNLSNNPNISCVEVDDVTYSTANWNQIDNLSALSLDCYNPPIVNIPDANFEQALIDLGLDTNGLNGNILQSDAETITSIEIGNPEVNTNLPNVNAKISDLTGIESMINLTYLGASKNAISTIDVSKNTKLTFLHLGNNQLTSIDVSKNTDLEFLWVEFNKLSEINVTKLTKLKKIYFSYNSNLSAIDVSQNILLEEFAVSNTNITNVDISKNVNITRVFIADTKINSLDLSNQINLDDLTIVNTDLISIDLSEFTNLKKVQIYFNKLIEKINLNNNSNTNITYIDVSRNAKLNCVQVDDVTYATANFTNIDDASFFSINCYNPAPIVNIPDANMKAALLADPFINTNGDNEIQVSEAEAIDKDIDKGEGLEIADLTGIEAFINITGLNIRNNNLTTVDLSKNTKLTWLSIDKNQLTDLDISALANLEVVYAGENKITNIDVSNNTKLKKLWLNTNEITSLDISNNALLEELQLDWNFGLSNIDFSKNLNLNRIHLWKTAISTLDVTNLLNLERLYVTETNLTSIDLSKNTKLYDIRAGENNISSFDFSKNLDLERIDIVKTNVFELDITKNTKLKRLWASENSLTGVNTTENILLEELILNNNNIINVDINQNKKLNTLLLNNNKIERAFLKNGANTSITNFNIINNEDLKCIAVDDVDFANTNWTSKDATASYNLDCSGEWEVYTTDANLKTTLNAVAGLDGDGDGIITYEEAQAFTGDLDLSGKNITSVAGLEAFTNATSINISGNSITDISSLINANTVVLSSRLTGKKRTLQRNTNNLKVLNVANNLIEEIDISILSDITELNVSNNNLTYLNINNSSNGTLTKFDATGNSKLGCIQVDNVANAIANTNWKKDATANYNTFCAKTLSIDEAFLRNNISIYPNPAISNVQISLSNGLELKSVELYNLVGKRVLKATKEQLDISNLANGIYFVKIISNKGNITKKLIKR